MNTTQDMRGLFYIVKGQYRANKRDELNTDGFNPDDPNTHEWYQLRDCKTHHCYCCGSNFDKVLHGVYTAIIKHKTARGYFKYVDDTTTEDYYRVHYLGKPPYTPEQRNKRAENGKSARVSPATKELYDMIYRDYGDYYTDQIGEMEDEAYRYLASQTPFGKTKKLTSKVRRKSKSEVIAQGVIETPPTPVVVKDKNTKKTKGVVIRPKKLTR